MQLKSFFYIIYYVGGSMKVVVNRDNCIGCGACESIEPNVFQLDDEGISKVIEENVESSNEENINDAIDSCPTAAIEKSE